MNDDELLPEGVPAFDDPAYDALRAELGDLGGGGPMPADVVTRLDDVLADLGGAPAGADPVVVPLRRRSRLGPRLLVAAAAVVAVGGGGVGLANVLQDGRGADKATTMTADESVPDAEIGAGGHVDLDQLHAGGATAGYSRGAPELTSTTFATGARTLIAKDALLAATLQRVERAQAFDATDGVGGLAGPLNTPAPDDRDGASSGDAQGAENGATDRSAEQLKNLGACGVRKIAGAVVRTVLLDRSPALLVVYPEVDGTRLVQARTCDANTVLVSATLSVG